MLTYQITLTNEQTRLLAAALQTARHSLEKQLMGSEVRENDKSAAAFAAFDKLYLPIEKHLTYVATRPERRKGK